MRAANAGCCSTSPPDNVMPPLVARNTLRYRYTFASRSAARTGTPRRAIIVSGLWQYRQRSGHPARNVVMRVPGPSTAVTSSHECRSPISPVRVPASSADRSASSTTGMPPSRRAEYAAASSVRT
jgi:hypothetical protein